MTDDEQTHKYSLLCDAVARIFYAEDFGIEPYEDLRGDQIGHTSDLCRKASAAAFEALEIW